MQRAVDAGERAAGRCARTTLPPDRIAATAHVEKYGYFPSGGWGMGWTGDPDRGTGGRQPGGWIYQLLPFMGNDMLHDMGVGQGLPTSGSAKYIALGQARGVPVAGFICPTRRKVMAYPDAINQGAVNGASAARTNKDRLRRQRRHQRPEHVQLLGPLGPELLHQLSVLQVWRQPGDADGIVYQVSEVRPAKISDGLDNTFFAGEKYLMPERYYTSRIRATTTACSGPRSTIPCGGAAARCPATRPGTPPTCCGRCATPRAWPATGPIRRGIVGSAHPSGVNFVFCDGHVLTISYSIDSTTYAFLGCRSDGQYPHGY